jgi:RHS repeat-associated protein
MSHAWIADRDRLRRLVALAVSSVLMVAGVALPMVSPASAAPTAEAVDTSTPPTGLVPELSTETSNTYRLADGQMRVESAAGPINYREDDGSWKPIDTTLVNDSSSAYAAQNAAAGYEAQIPADAGSTPVKFAVDDAWVTLKMRGLDGNPVIGDDTATYGSVPGAESLTLQTQPSALKESITLDRPPASSDLAYVYDLRTSPGVTPRNNPDGSIDFLDRDGRARASIPAGAMYDSTPGTPASSSDVGYSLIGSDTRWVLTVRPDLRWLTSPARVYPVVVDPTVGLPEVPERIDCVLKSADANGAWCYSANDYIRVGKDSSGNRYRGLVDFHLGNIPDGSTINDAYVQLTVGAQTSTNGAAQSYAVAPTANRFTNAATWNKFDGFNDWAGGQPGAPTGTPTYLNLNASSGTVYFGGMGAVVQGWINNRSSQTGFVIYANHNAKHVIAFRPSSAGTPPQLVVTYTAPVVTHPAPTVTVSSTCASAGSTNGTITVSIHNNDADALNATASIANQSGSAGVGGYGSGAIVLSNISAGTYSGAISFSAPHGAQGLATTVSTCALVPYEPEPFSDRYPVVAAQAIPLPPPQPDMASQASRVDALAATNQAMPAQPQYGSINNLSTDWSHARDTPIDVRDDPAANEGSNDNLSVEVKPIRTGAAAGNGSDPALGTPALQVRLTTTLNSDGNQTGLLARLSYADFAKSFGGNWADRLVVTAHPACFLTAPQTTGCSLETRVPFVNDAGAQRLEFAAAPPLVYNTGVPAPPTASQLDSCFSGSSITATVADDWTDDTQQPEPSTDPDTSATDDAASSGDGGDYDDDDAANDAVSDTATPARPVNNAAPAPVLDAAASGPAVCQGLVYEVRGGAGGYAMAAADGSTSGDAPSGPATLQASSAWQVGSGSGEFSWSYPFTLPTDQAGQSPSLSLSYSSAEADGMTGSSPGQVSQAGIGWSMDPGHISRTFASCADDDPDDNTGDLCWRTETINGQKYVVNDLSLVLAGHATRLIRDQVSGKYRLQDDPGWRVESRNGPYSDSWIEHDGTDAPENTDGDDEAFRITSPDGTRYYFGFGQTSVWTVPVRGNTVGEPCHGAALDSAACRQAWQWNLDRVVDADGNRVKYTYASEVNHYKSLSDGLQEYDRAGALTKIEYAFPRGSGNENAAAQAVVEVSTAGRCNDSIAARPDDHDANGASTYEAELACTAALQNPDGEDWPDTPIEQRCGPGSSSTCMNYTPTFFSMKRYDRVRTYRGTTAQQRSKPVDEYVFTHGMHKSGPEDPDLWLASIHHLPSQALSDSTDQLPQVTFAGQPYDNRVVPLLGGRGLAKERLETITNELGGQIDVVYGQQRPCANADVEGWAASDSPKDCFAPRRPGGSDENLTWYNKYLVKQVTLTDQALGLYLDNPRTDGTNFDSLGTVRQYKYTYRGKPGWRYDGLSKNTPARFRSWSDWRGYQTTLIRTMAVDPSRPDHPKPTASSIRRVTVYRGLYNSRADSNGNLRDTPADGGYVATIEHPAAADGSPSEALPDRNALSGRVAEETILQPGGCDDCAATWISRSYHGFEVLRTARNNLGLAAAFVGETLARTHRRATRSQSDGAVTHHDWRRTVETDFHDGGSDHRGLRLGVVLEVTDRGANDSGHPGGDLNTCTTTTWLANSDAWLRAAKDVQVSDQAVAGQDCTLPRSHTTNYYDGNETSADINGQSEDDRLTRAEPTRTDTYTSANSAITARAEYDAYGRPRRSVDGRGLVTSTTYNRTPAGDPYDGLSVDDLPAQVVTTVNPNPASDPKPQDVDTLVRTQSLTRFDTLRGSPIQVTDLGNPNLSTDNATATYGYDGYGRILCRRSATLNPPAADDGTLSDPGHQSPFRCDEEPMHNDDDQAEYVPPSTTYTYSVSNSKDKPARVKTTTRRDATHYDSSWSYSDGWGRTVETQTLQADGVGRLASETAYNELGLAYRESPVVVANDNDAPGSGLVNARATAPQHYTETAYDAAGRPTAVVNRVHGGEARSTTIVEPQGDRTVTHRAIAPDQPAGASTVSTVDGWGRTVKLEQYTTAAVDDTATRAHAAQYSYDGLGDLTAINSRIGNQDANWSYTYDLASRRTRSVDPDTGQNDVTYDANGNVVTTTNAADGTVKTWYDSLDRPTKRFKTTGDPGNCPLPPSTQSGCDPLASWTYDTALNGFGAARATTSYTRLGTYTTSVDGYDRNGNVTAVGYDYPETIRWIPLSSGRTTVTEQYAYNDANMVTSTNYSGIGNLRPLTVNTGYTTNGQVSTMVANQAGQPSVTLLLATYDKTGRPVRALSEQAGNPNHLNREYDYDNATDWVKRVGGSVFGTLDYTHDVVGNIATATEHNLFQDISPDYVSAAWCYSYDALDRLSAVKTGTSASEGCATQVDGTSPTGTYESPTNLVGAPQDYTYEYSEDRLTKVTDNLVGASSSYVYAGTPHQTAQINRTANDGALPQATLSYDSAGRVKNLSGEVRTYDPTGTLQSSRDVRYGIPLTTDYAYDPEGMRVAYRSHFQGEDDEVDTVRYFGSTEVYSMNDGTSTRMVLNSPGGTPLAVVTGSTAASPGPPTWQFQLGDAQNSIRSIRRTTGQSYGDARIAYRPFGQPIVGTAAYVSGNRTFLNKPSDFNGDIRLDQRNYQPELNVLTTPDALMVVADPQNLNPYAYARNNPARWSDPSGLLLPAVGGACDMACNETSIFTGSGSSGGSTVGGIVSGAGSLVGNVVTSTASDVKDFAVGSVESIGGSFYGLGNYAGGGPSATEIFPTGSVDTVEDGTALVRDSLPTVAGLVLGGPETRGVVGPIERLLTRVLGNRLTAPAARGESSTAFKFFRRSGTTRAVSEVKPNATVRDLLDIEPGNLPQPFKSGPTSRRSDQQLLDSVMQPRDGVHMYLSRDGALIEGNHRRYELLARASDPRSSINLDTPIYIDGAWPW